MDPIRIWYQSYVDHDHGAVYWERLKAHLADIALPGTEIDIKGITPHDSYAHSIVEFRCGREVICNAVTAQEQGYDAFVIGHFQDAGLYEARSVVDIPVLGLGEASMLYSCTLGQRVSLITINTRYISWLRHQILKYGLRERIIGVHAMQFEPGQMLRAYEDDKLAAEVVSLFAEQARPLVREGSEVLVPGGGIPMVLFSSFNNHAVDGAPVVNGIPVVVMMAEMAVRLRRATGLNTSRVGEFVKPPAEIIEEFLSHPKGL